MDKNVKGKHKVLKSVCLSLLIAAAVTVISLFLVKIKIEIDYPNASTNIRLEMGEQTKELDTKRFYGDRVFANAGVKDIFEWGYVRIYFICDPGTTTTMENIRISVGNLVAKTYDILDETEYIASSELAVQEAGDNVKYLTTTGENPSILISHLKRITAPYLILHCVMVFGITFLLGLLIFAYAGKHEQKVALYRKKITEYCRSYAGRDILEILLAVAAFFGGYYLLIKKEVFMIKGMDSWEVLFLFLGLLILFFALWKRTDKWYLLLICEIVAGIFLFLSIYNLTSYLTVDEPRAIMEQSHLQESDFRHWYMGESYMNFSIMGFIWKLVPDFLISDGIIMEEQLAKLLHWLCGILLLYLIAGQTERFLANRKKAYDRAIVYTAIVVALLAIPVVPETLKNYNYDMFSVMFGLLGIVEVCICVQERSRTHGVWGVVFLTFSTVEKMIGLPAWLLGMGFVIYEISKEQEKEEKQSIGRIGKIAGVTLLMFAGVLLLVYGIEMFTLGFVREVSPIYTFTESVEMVFSMPGIAIKMIGEKIGIAVTHTMILMISSICYILGEVILVILIQAVMKWMQQEKHARIGNRILSAGILLFLIAGILESAFFPVSEMPTFLLGLWGYCGTFVEAFPTVLLLAVAIAVVIEGKKQKFEPYLVILFMAGAGMSAFYTATGLAVNARYYDLYIALMGLTAIVILSNRIIEKRVLAGICAAGSIVTAAEIAGSMPAFTYFVPYWNVIPSSVQNRELRSYWGEQWVVMSNLLEEYCEENGIDASNVTLHCSYPGDILRNDTQVQIGQYWWRLDGYENPTENDYFVFEVRSVRYGYVTHGLPENVEPVLTIKYHGTTTAWMYRGSDLIDYFEQYKYDEANQ